ncbi:unnamed protein product, partial [Scytosiphon promiscuus]
RTRIKPNASHSSGSRLLLASGLLVFAFVAFEFWVMHHHAPSHQQHDGRFPFFKVSGSVPPDGDSTALPGAPLVPDSMRPFPAMAVRTETPLDPLRAPHTGVFELPPREPLLEEQVDKFGGTLGGTNDKEEGYGDMRVAVLVPYSGPGLPLWFDAFTDLAAANKDLVDWIIFCEEDLAQVRTPSNVRMISTSPAKLAWMLAGVVYPADADEYPELYVSDYETAVSGHLTDSQKPPRNARGMAAKFIQKLLSKNPYYMVEFKPALGWVFREYLKEYSHWAYGDLDVFFGDLTKGWLEPSEMRDYDIITYSFGDQHRAYLRGQLTVHKSIPKVNGIWRNCPHLSNYLRRIERTIETKQYNLESAEGCYSMAVMYSKDIKAKYAVKVFTDMPGGLQGDQEEVVITGDALVKRCPQQEGRRGDVIEPDYGGSMQVDKGPYFPVEAEEKGSDCEYWINPNFQTCLKLKESATKTNVFLLKGRYYERDFVNLWRDKVEDGCSMGAFHHFQEFKGSYRAWNTRPPMPPIHTGMVAGNGGLVPLPNGDWYAMAVDPDAPPPADRDRFTYRYCLQWNVLNDRTKDAKFICDISLTPRDGLRTLHDSRPESARRGSLTGGAAVTLGGVGGFSDVPRLLRSAREWKGPKVFVLMLRDTLQEKEDVQELIRSEEELGVLDNAYIVYFFSPYSAGAEVNDGDLPTKALLNAVGDLCQTSRHLLTLPPGFSIARGAEEAVVTALETPTEAPRVLIIPQWCVDPRDRYLAEPVPSLDLKDLRRRTVEGTASLCLAREDTESNSYLGVTVMEAALDEEESAAGMGGFGDAVPAVQSKGTTRKTKSGLALLRSDAASPVIVVDLWSAPALFLRHIE